MIRELIAELVVALGVITAASSMATVEDPIRCVTLITTPSELLDCLDH
ncbi:hypothetical protein [Nocardia crassostreae]|nr:hypothetical protein [Nocardia crassostreae]